MVTTQTLRVCSDKFAPRIFKSVIELCLILQRKPLGSWAEQLQKMKDWITEVRFSEFPEVGRYG